MNLRISRSFIREIVVGVLEVEFGLCIVMLEPWLPMLCVNVVE